MCIVSLSPVILHRWWRESQKANLGIIHNQSTAHSKSMTHRWHHIITSSLGAGLSASPTDTIPGPVSVLLVLLCRSPSGSSLELFHTWHQSDSLEAFRWTDSWELEICLFRYSPTYQRMIRVCADLLGTSTVFLACSQLPGGQMGVCQGHWREHTCRQRQALKGARGILLDQQTPSLV